MWRCHQERGAGTAPRLGSGEKKKSQTNKEADQSSRVGRGEWMPGQKCQRYLVNGSHDLAGLLIENFRAPVRIKHVQFFDQPVVLSQKERVQGDHPQMLIGSRITCETSMIKSLSTETCREWTND